jgi:hypothetical protein
VNNTITGVARIQQVVDNTIDGIARIQKTVDQTINGKARIQQVIDGTITGVANIQPIIVLQDITGVANIKNSTDQNITGKAWIILPYYEIECDENTVTFNSETDCEEVEITIEVDCNITIIESIPDEHTCFVIDFDLTRIRDENTDRIIWCNG